MAFDYDPEIEKRRKYANRVIEKWLPPDAGMPGSLCEAMRYSVTAGGKRIRPILMNETYRIFGGADTDIEPFMAAIELIHTSSLVHDDLPAIDNDDLRRGVRTTHAEFGEAIGVLAGDALLNYAYEVIMSGVLNAKDPACASEAAFVLAKKSGYTGMLGGQSVDVENEKKGLDTDKLEMLDLIYRKKTAALIEASLMAGGILAGADKKSVLLLEQIGEKLGIAFQIRDDILDVISDTKTLGKPVFSDIQNKKETYSALIGVEKASEQVAALTAEAIMLIKELPGDTSFLKEMFLKLAQRRK